MPKFRKKPVEIEAMQFNFRDMEGVQKVLQWIRSGGGAVQVNMGDLGVKSACIHTLEGPQFITNGDWIIKGIANEFYPCKPHVFDAKYETVEE